MTVKHPYTHGEKVNLLLQGVRIEQEPPGADGVRYLEFTQPNGGHYFRIRVDGDDVTIVHLEPAHWPPRPGDLWADHEDLVWFAADITEARHRENPGTDLVMVCQVEDLRFPPEDVLQRFGPLRLVHRRGLPPINDQEDQSR